MIIEETIKRECCNPIKGDLEPCPYKNQRKALYFKPDMTFKCKHCGQQWQWTRQPDEGAGGTETALIIAKEER